MNAAALNPFAFARHRFQRRQPTRLLLRTQQQTIARGEIDDDARLLADKRAVFENTETTRTVLGVGPFTAVAYHDEPRLHTFFQHPRKDFDAVDGSFHGTKV